MIALELVADYFKLGLQVCPEIGVLSFSGIFQLIHIAPFSSLTFTCP